MCVCVSMCVRGCVCARTDLILRKLGLPLPDSWCPLGNLSSTNHGRGLAGHCLGMSVCVISKHCDAVCMRSCVMSVIIAEKATLVRADHPDAAVQLCRRRPA